MLAYFTKATYTNGIYKISDFYTGNNYKLTPSRSLDILLEVSDGVVLTKPTTGILGDSTNIRDYTHMLVPSQKKIYRITKFIYVNINQTSMVLEEDPLIGHYQTLKDEDIILMRTNDSTLFRGVNDIADLTVKKTVETKVISSDSKTGKWALIFFQYNKDKTSYGLNFAYDIVSLAFNVERFSTITALTTAYPESLTDTPNIYNYYQKIVYVTEAGSSGRYQCVYYKNRGVGRLKWVLLTASALQTYGSIYFRLGTSVGNKLYASDIKNIIIALPYEDLQDSDSDRIYSFQHFIGPVDSGDVIDIKIVDDILLKDLSVTYSLTDRQLTKNITSNFIRSIKTYSDAALTNELTDDKFLLVNDFVSEIDLNPRYFTTTPVPTDAEPFKKYELNIFGKNFDIPYYLTNDIKLLIAINSGVINYTIFYNDKRNILASGSFTHSMRYKVDKLDDFYNQNPTYKEQFWTNQISGAIKSIGVGAIGGAVKGGPIGAAAGAAAGLANSAVSTTIASVNLHFQEKGLRLMPDQIYGDISELTLQFENIFGIYWVKKTSENADMMRIEYDLKGFPTSYIKKISDLTRSTSIFGSSVVIYGEIKNVIKNEFTTGFINSKLKEGIILVP